MPKLSNIPLPRRLDVAILRLVLLTLSTSGLLIPAPAWSAGTGKLLTIKVTVNDRSGAFLVDTGADWSFIDSGFARELGLRGHGTADVRRNYTSESWSVVSAGQLELWGRQFRNVPLIEADLNAMSRAMGETIRGVLGTDLLRSFHVRLMYSSSSIAEAPGLQDAGGLIRLKKTDGGYFIPVRIGTHEFDLLVDTGANSTVVADWVWSSLPESRAQAAVIRGVLAADNPHETAYGCASAIELGGLMLQNQPLRVTSRTSQGNFSHQAFAGILGADVLQRFVVTFDLEDSAIYLKPDANYRPDPYAFSSIGIQFARTPEGAFSVASTWSPSPAAESGIQTGDLIVLVNGRDTRELSLEGFAEQLHKPAGTKVTLGVQRAHETVMVHTTVRHLICGSRPLGEVEVK